MKDSCEVLHTAMLQNRRIAVSLTSDRHRTGYITALYPRAFRMVESESEYFEIDDIAKIELLATGVETTVTSKGDAMEREDQKVYDKMVKSFVKSEGWHKDYATQKVNEILAVQGKLPPKVDPLPDIGEKPWHDADSGSVVWSADGLKVCEMSERSGTLIMEANKALILAAPDLMNQVLSDRKLIIECKANVPLGQPYTKMNDSVNKSHAFLIAAGVTWRTIKMPRYNKSQLLSWLVSWDSEFLLGVASALVGSNEYKNRIHNEAIEVVSDMDVEAQVAFLYSRDREPGDLFSNDLKDATKSELVKALIDSEHYEAEPGIYREMKHDEGMGSWTPDEKEKDNA